MWDLSFLTRDRTLILCIAKWVLNHWTTREVSSHFNFEQTEKAQGQEGWSVAEIAVEEICNLTV